MAKKDDDIGSYDYGDEFFPFDDDFLKDDDGSSQGGETPKGMKSFFKNVAKSTKGLTFDITRQQLPNILEFGASLKDTIILAKDASSRAKLKTAELAGKLRTGKDFKTTLSDFKKDIKSDLDKLKSGTFYIEEADRVEIDMDAFMGDDDSGSTTVESQPETELADEPFGKTNTVSAKTTLKKSKKTVNPFAAQMKSSAMISKTVAASAEANSKATSNAAIATISTMNQIFTKQFEIDEKRFRTHMGYQHDILTSVDAIAKQVINVGTLDVQAGMEYRSKNLAIMQDTAMLLKDIKQVLTYSVPEYQQKETKLSKVLSGGQLNSEEYFKNIKENASRMIGSTSVGTLMDVGGMGLDMMSMSKDMGMKNKISPTSMITGAVVNSLLSKGLKQRFGVMNDLFSNAGGMFVGKMNQMSRFSNNPLVKGLGELLGIKDSYVKRADLGLKDPSAKANFDAKTHRSVTEVIPGYLSKILATLSGEEETFYDYKTGTYKTASSIKKIMEREEGRAYESKYELTRLREEMVKSGIKDKRAKDISPQELESDFKQIIKNIVDSAMVFTPENVFKDDSYTDQLTTGTKNGKASLAIFLSQYMNMDFQERATFDSNIIGTLSNVQTTTADINKSLMEYGGAGIASEILSKKEADALTAQLTYSSYTDASKYKKGTAAYAQTLKRRREVLEQQERISGEGTVGYVKSSVNEDGDINITSSAGIWQNMYDLLLKGIIVFPQSTNELPPHISEGLKKRGEALQKIFDESNFKKDEQDLRSQEIRELANTQRQQAWQIRKTRSLGLVDSLGLRGEKFSIENPFNQFATRILNTFEDSMKLALYGKDAKFGEGYGTIKKGLEEAQMLYKLNNENEISVLGDLSKMSDKKGLKGFVGKQAGNLKETLDKKRQKSKTKKSNINIDDRGVLIGKEKGKFGKALDEKKKLLLNHLREKGVFNKIDDVTTKLFWSTKYLTDEEINEILKKEAKEEIEEIKEMGEDVSPTELSSSEMVSSIIKTSKIKSNTPDSSDYTPTKGIKIQEAKQSTDFLSNTIEKNLTIDSSAIVNKIDSTNKRLDTIISLINDLDFGYAEEENENIYKNKRTRKKRPSKLFGRITSGMAGIRSGITGIGSNILGLGSTVVKGGVKALGVGGVGGLLIGGIPGALIGGIGGKLLSNRGNKNVDKVKEFAKNVKDAIKSLGPALNGKTLEERLKIIKEYAKDGLISSEVEKFITDKLSAAAKKGTDLDMAFSGLHETLDNMVNETKNKGSNLASKLSKAISHGAKTLGVGGVGGIKSGSSTAIGGIKGISSTAIGGIKGGIDSVIGLVKDVFGNKKVDKVKEFAKNVRDSIKSLGPALNGKTLEERLKIIKEYAKDGLISSEVEKFITDKLSVAAKKGIDLDMAFSGLHETLDNMVNETKNKGSNLASKLSKAISHGAKTVGIGGIGGLLMGGIPGALIGAIGGKLLSNRFNKQDGLIGRGKNAVGSLLGRITGKGSGEPREGSLADKIKDKKLDEAEDRSIVQATLIAQIASTTTAINENLKFMVEKGGGIGIDPNTKQRGRRGRIGTTLSAIGGAGLVAAGGAAIGAGIANFGRGSMSSIRNVGKAFTMRGNTAERVGQAVSGTNDSNYDSEGNEIAPEDRSKGSLSQLPQAALGLKGIIAGGKAVIGTGAKMASTGSKMISKSAAAGGKVAGLLTKIGSFLTKMFTRNPFAKFLKGGTARTLVKTIIQRLSGTALGRFAAKIGTKIAAVATPIGWAMVAADFASGMSRADRYFRLPRGSRPTIGMRVTSGIVKVLSGLLFGLLPPKTTALSIYEKIGGEVGKDHIEKTKEFTENRARLLGVEPNRLIDYETMTLMERMGGKDRAAAIIGFGRDDLQTYEKWKSEKYEPLNEMFDSTKAEFGGRSITGAPSTPDEEELQENFKATFLQRAQEFIQSDPELNNLKPGGKIKESDTTSEIPTDIPSSASATSTVNKVERDGFKMAAMATAGVASTMNVVTSPEDITTAAAARGDVSTMNSQQALSKMQSQASAVTAPTLNQQPPSLLGKMSAGVGSLLSKAFKGVKNFGRRIVTGLKNLALPALGRLSSLFGPRPDPFGSGNTIPHNGIDIAGPIGTSIRAYMDGSVHMTGTDHPVLGKYIVLKHAQNMWTVYGHLSSITVKQGDQVTQNQEIGQMGNTGTSTGPHLHFTVIKDNQIVDPVELTQNGRVSGGAPLTNFYRQLIGKPQEIQAAITDAQESSKEPINPYATSLEEIQPNNDILVDSSNENPNVVQKIGNLFKDRKARRTAKLQESPIVTSSMYGAGGSEHINLSMDATRLLLDEQTRHNDLSENFYQQLEEILKELNERDKLKFDMYKNKDREATRKQNMFQSQQPAIPISRQTHRYSLEQYDNIAAGY